MQDQNANAARELTFGERLVGINFNPSADDKVAQAKQLFAKAADILHDDFYSKPEGERGNVSMLLFTHTVGEILNAQMNVVKVLTLKY